MTPDAGARARQRTSVRLRIDLGQAGGGPGLLAAHCHEQRGEQRNGDDRSGRDDQHDGGKQEDHGQRDKDCTDGQAYSESDDDIICSHWIWQRTDGPSSF